MRDESLLKLFFSDVAGPEADRGGARGEAPTTTARSPRELRAIEAEARRAIRTARPAPTLRFGIALQRLRRRTGASKRGSGGP